MLRDRALISMNQFMAGADPSLSPRIRMNQHNNEAGRIVRVNVCNVSLPSKEEFSLLKVETVSFLRGMFGKISHVRLLIKEVDFIK